MSDSKRIQIRLKQPVYEKLKRIQKARGDESDSATIKALIILHPASQPPVEKP